jgi:UDP:flavonoid glycosyltransferase YjiC (YdhE family)
MRALITAMGSRGDVQPMLTLALEMRRRGHEVLVHAPSDFEAWAGELGLPFHSAGVNTQEILNEHSEAIGGNPVQVIRALRDILFSEMPRAFDQTLKAAKGADVIVTAAQFAAHSVGEALRIPSINVMYVPTMLRSAHHPPLMGKLQGSPRWVNRLRWKLADAGINAVLRGALNKERARLGLPPIANASRHLFEERPAILACDCVVGPAPPDWNGYDVTVTGPLYYDDPAALDARVEAFLDAGPPPVYVGFGSMTSPDASRLTNAILEGGRGRRLLLAKGWAGIGGANLPESVMVVDGPMPHAKLFPRVAAVVHHGGSGTTAAALRAGAPQVVVPHVVDQYYFAHRLRSLGIAPAGIPIRKLTPERLARAMDAAIALPAAPRMEAAARLKQADGVRLAAQAIEKRVH